MLDSLGSVAHKVQLVQADLKGKEELLENGENQANLLIVENRVQQDL